MSRAQSWLTFGIVSALVFILYLLGIFEFLPFIGDQFSGGRLLVRAVILFSLALFLLIVARVVANLVLLAAERKNITRASLIADKPSGTGSTESESNLSQQLAELPKDGLLASRVELLTTYVDEQKSVDEVCLLLARQSGLDNEYGELVFGSELVILGLMNIVGFGGVLILMSDVITVMLAAISTAGDFRAQAASPALPLMGSIFDIMLAVLILYTVARLLVRVPQKRQRLAIIAADELALYFISKSKVLSQRTKSAEMGTTFDGMELSETVDAAFRAVANICDPDSPLQTAPLLIALARADMSGRWDRIEIETGQLARLPGQYYLDPAPSAERYGMSWDENLCFSDTLADALVLCKKICRAYKMEVIHPGVVALALLACPQSGASRCLLRFSDLSHSHLIDLVQEELIGRNLVGVGPLMQHHLLRVDRHRANSVAGDSCSHLEPTRSRRSRQ